MTATEDEFRRVCDCGAVPDGSESTGCGDFIDEAGNQAWICLACWCEHNYGRGAVETLEAKRQAKQRWLSPRAIAARWTDVTAQRVDNIIGSLGLRDSERHSADTSSDPLDRAYSPAAVALIERELRSRGAVPA